MTKEQILALIDAKIAGQGTNIDAGSALPEILSGILDLIPEPPSGPTYKVIRFAASFDAAMGVYDTKQEMIEALGFESESDFDAVMSGQMNILFDGEENWIALRADPGQNQAKVVFAYFESVDETIAFPYNMLILQDGKYSVGEN